MLGFGGALAISFSTAEIASTMLADSATRSNGGGGLFAWHGVVRGQNVTVRNNTAVWGGGWYGVFESELRCEGCTFDSNTATEWGGGAASRDSTHLQARRHPSF